MAMQNPSPSSGQVQMYGWFIPSPPTPIQIKQTIKKNPAQTSPSTQKEHTLA